MSIILELKSFKLGRVKPMWEITFTIQFELIRTYIRVYLNNWDEI